ncbi:MAG: hypothetical protein JWM78_1394 [Verrucomicrobiaceae bacterium]|nr:hypothetical protein [Verrucomicrobiaceae bacterium]
MLRFNYPCVANYAAHQIEFKSKYETKSPQLSGLFVLTMTIYNLNWSGMEDLNLRPLRPERSALPDCANARNLAVWPWLPARRATIAKQFVDA